MQNISQPSTSVTTRLDGTASAAAIAKRLRPPLAFSTPSNPWRLRLHIDKDTSTSLVIEVSNQVSIGRTDMTEGYTPGIDLGPYNAQDFGVSRRHAMIYVIDSPQGSELHIRDLSSTNGTKVNGFLLKAEQAYKLVDGDELEFGQFRVSVQVVAAPE
jgi:hypothetical protein